MECSKFTTMKIWQKTLKILNMISALSGNSMAQEIDDFANRRLKKLEAKEKDAETT